MSKTQYKISKNTDILQKMKVLPLMQRINLYKPCPPMVNINNIAWVFIRHEATLRYLVIHFKGGNPYSKDIAISFHWKIQNLEAIKCLKEINLKTDVLQKIDKTIMLVYMAVFGDDSGVKPKISKPYRKTATWRSEHGLFMR
ncbi:hypothetical protein ME7_01184 [Bartonella birtlesii LL-WM9]|uniref:Uncharacterized protein n=2 Tax=Bartonella birtlesii TaxID=111504 RepID=J1IY47_9HYPH|nr:hypothetical protein [Bartonella birtlesii]EJF76195.1 hypothetical protein ME7_01184 [Bartonella birtlesii LL-WM9]